jgi:hypothetical protein
MGYHKYPMRNKLITLVAITLALPVWVACQQAPPQPSPDDVVQELRMLERKWTTALVRADTQALADILDDTYMDADEDGNQTDKAGVIAAVKSGELKLNGIQLSNLKVHSFIYAAVVTGRAVQTGTFKGQKLPPSIVFTDTFVMMNGQWKVAASHRSARQIH